MRFSPGVIPSFFQSHPQSSVPCHLIIHSFLREGPFFVLRDRTQRCRLVFIVLHLLWKAHAPALFMLHLSVCTGAIGSHCLAPKTQASTEGCFMGCRHTRANQHVITMKNISFSWNNSVETQALVPGTSLIAAASSPLLYLLLFAWLGTSKAPLVFRQKRQFAAA